MNEYKSDIKIVLFLLVCVVLAVLLNLDYLFSDNTINQVILVDKVEITEINNSKFSNK